MKLSVMVITYNHERFLAQALESILAQRVNFEYEIVIGEDCSTDSTRDVISDFLPRSSGRIISFLRDQNVGVMRNLQETLEACRGQYVALLEGDDFWTCENKLQRQVDFLDAHPNCAISCHRARVLDEMGTAEHKVFPFVPAGVYTIDDLLRGNFIMTCTAVCRWNSFGRLPDWFLDLSLGDWPLFALLSKRGTIHLMDEVMAGYRVHEGGIWSARTESSRLQESIRMLKTLDRELNFEHAGTIRDTLARFYLYLGEISRRDHRRAETARCVMNCLRYGGAALPKGIWRLRGLFWYALFGSWYETFSAHRRTI